MSLKEREDVRPLELVEVDATTMSISPMRSGELTGLLLRAMLLRNVVDCKGTLAVGGDLSACSCAWYFSSCVMPEGSIQPVLPLYATCQRRPSLWIISTVASAVQSIFKNHSVHSASYLLKVTARQVVSPCSRWAMSTTRGQTCFPARPRGRPGARSSPVRRA